MHSSGRNFQKVRTGIGHAVSVAFCIGHMNEDQVYSKKRACSATIQSRIYPGISLEQVQAEIGWEVRLAETISEAMPPNAEELELIRVRLDPGGMYSR
jgi:hypothetical protein